MSYISSDKIEIFPYSRTRTINGNTVNNDRLLYEKRVANIIRQCLGMKSGNTGIILSDTIDASVSNNTLTFNADFEFNIWGYYIKMGKMYLTDKDYPGKADERAGLRKKRSINMFIKTYL